jgi:hypothetical protein
LHTEYKPFLFKLKKDIKKETEILKKIIMHVYALFIERNLYNIYKNYQDAENDCKRIKEKGTTLTILIKPYILVEAPLYP